ncbi:hypothetical protein ABZ352_25555 [Streptomyces griseofuscus]|uniref:hypothetical protein n=1 Tax=Streptomyces griseofuscus TaxID=146922 RepID=UPI0033E931E2
MITRLRSVYGGEVETVQPLAGDEPAAIGPYRLLGRLGAGGMDRVHLGRSAGARTVAVQIVHPQFALDSAPHPLTAAPMTTWAAKATGLGGTLPMGTLRPRPPPDRTDPGRRRLEVHLGERAGGPPGGRADEDRLTSLDLKHA